MLKTLFDTTYNHVQALKTLGRPVEHWDNVIVHMVSTKLPPDIRKTWEIESANHVDFSMWKTLCKFVKCHIHALEVMKFQQGSSGKTKQSYNKIVVHVDVEQKKEKTKCLICSQPHIFII